MSGHLSNIDEMFKVTRFEGNFDVFEMKSDKRLGKFLKIEVIKK